VLEKGTVATNVFLRRIHNFALDMNWLPCPIIPRKLWPAVRFKDKRAITFEEHQKIIARERNPEANAFYRLLWQLGGSQTDIATLHGKDLDWTDCTLGYSRHKNKSIALIHFGEEAAAILRTLPSSGPLFPRLEKMHEKHRAKEFKRRCEGLNIDGITLHSYRYAWAERAKTSGYPERVAQQALGHNSKAVHRAYAKKAQVKLPSLEEYEKELLPVDFKQVKAV
jgi:integrase